MEITNLLVQLGKDTRFEAIKALRNTLAHRHTGVVYTLSSLNAVTRRPEIFKEVWTVKGIPQTSDLNEDLLKTHLDAVTDLLRKLPPGARQLIELAFRLPHEEIPEGALFRGLGQLSREQGAAAKAAEIEYQKKAIKRVMEEAQRQWEAEKRK